MHPAPDALYSKAPPACRDRRPSDAAVAMLELPARAARARRVARGSGPWRAGARQPLRLAPVDPIPRGAVDQPRPALGARARGRGPPGGAGGAHLPRHRLTGHRLLGLGPDIGKGRLLHSELDMREHRGYLLAQIDQHRLEQAERLAFILVQRIALGIGAQIDALAQVIER